MDVLEQYQIEILLEQLEKKYPSDFKNIDTIKQNLFHSGQSFSQLTTELNEAMMEKRKLDLFLQKYQVGYHDTLTEKSFEKKYGNYTIEELKKMTEGMTEEEVIEYLRIHGQNPGQITMILLALEEQKAQEQVYEKPKQMVLTAPKKNQKIAAFTNTLTLTFLVGMISGMFFFAMLRILLHASY